MTACRLARCLTSARRGEAHEGVARADVEVDVRQRLDPKLGAWGSLSTWATSLRKRRSLAISTASSMMSTPKRLLTMMDLRMK